MQRVYIECVLNGGISNQKRFAYRKLPTNFGSTIGDLWEICGLSVAFYKRVSIIMLQKSSARKMFCAEGWRI